MGYNYDWNWDEYDFDVDIKQDIDTYIDWDVDTDINVDIKKDVDIKVDADVDVKDQGALIELVVKDIDLKHDEGGAIVVADTTAIENVLSSSTLQVQTTNTFADLSANALDQQASPYAMDYGYFDSATFTEINLGIDNVQGEYTIVTLNMEALVDG